MRSGSQRVDIEEGNGSEASRRFGSALTHASSPILSVEFVSRDSTRAPHIHAIRRSIRPLRFLDKGWQPLQECYFLPVFLLRQLWKHADWAGFELR
eukprot:scaffold23211_cov100-Skeletonema_marinoi.AAC.2